MALYSLLDRLAGTAHRWELRGKLIRVHSRTWPEDRRREVPLRLVRRWQEMFARQGALPLGEYLSILSTLSDDQLEEFLWLVQRGPFPPDFIDLTGLAFGRHAVRLYASLTPAQRGLLERGEPLRAARMTPAQQGLFRRAVTTPPRYWPVAVSLLPLADATLSLETEPVVRIREERGGILRIRDEKVPAVPARLPPMGTAAGAGTPAADGRFPATRLRLHLQYGPAERETAELTVAAAR